jgi:hypothetical protein
MEKVCLKNSFSHFSQTIKNGPRELLKNCHLSSVVTTLFQQLYKVKIIIGAENVIMMQCEEELIIYTS